MAATVYIFRLQHTVTASELRILFSPHGTVEDCQVMMDRSTGASKGFGFVEMSTAAEARAASLALDGLLIMGRSVRVKPARP